MNFVVDAHGAIGFVSAMSERTDLRNQLGHLVAARLRQDALEQFQAGGIPGWKPLSPRTIEGKRRAGYPRLNRRGQIPKNMIQNGHFGPENILMRTGALLSSWTQEQDPDHVELITAESVTTGSSVSYAGVHQQGGGNVPKRPINVTDDAQRDVAKMAEHFIVTGEESPN